MKTYVLAVAAELDLDAIWEYIAEDNIDAADHWTAKLFDAFEALAAMPRMGPCASGADFPASVVLAGRGLPDRLQDPR